MRLAARSLTRLVTAHKLMRLAARRLTRLDLLLFVLLTLTSLRGYHMRDEALTSVRASKQTKEMCCTTHRRTQRTGRRDQMRVLHFTKLHVTHSNGNRGEIHPHPPHDVEHEQDMVVSSSSGVQVVEELQPQSHRCSREQVLVI